MVAGGVLVWVPAAVLHSGFEVGMVRYEKLLGLFVGGRALSAFLPYSHLCLALRGGWELVCWTSLPPLLLHIVGPRAYWRSPTPL